MWEAFEHAGHARLDNLTAIIDVNRIVVAEDHWPEGGLGDAVLGVFADSEESPRDTGRALLAAPDDWRELSVRPPAR